MESDNIVAGHCVTLRPQLSTADGGSTEPFPQRNYFNFAALQPTRWRQFASWFNFSRVQCFP